MIWKTMKTITKKPLFVYDGECQFCRMCVDYLEIVTGDRVCYEPFQKVADKFPNIPRREFTRKVMLITLRGGVYSSAHAIFKVLAYNPRRRFFLWLYKNIPGFSFFSEIGYRLVASNRGLAHRFVRLFIGKRLEPPSYISLRWIFFSSAWVSVFSCDSLLRHSNEGTHWFGGHSSRTAIFRCGISANWYRRVLSYPKSFLDLC